MNPIEPGADVEVLVVGAGVIGAAVAHRLAVAGRSVAVVAPDPARAHGSATTASGAMLGVLGEVTKDDPEALARRIEAMDAYPTWLADVERHGTVVPALGRGTFVVASACRESDVRAVSAIERTAASANLACERVEPEDVPGLVPQPGHRPARVLHLAQEAWIDGPGLRTALLNAAHRAGARVVVGSVRRLRVDNSVRGVELADGSNVASSHVVLCGGADVPSLLAASGLGTDLVPPVVHAKGASVTLRRGGAATGDPPTHTLRSPNRAFACGLHVVPRPDGRMYVGATNRASRLPAVLGGATADEVVLLLGQARRELHTGLGSWDLDGAASGHRALSVDRRPIVGQTAVDGLLVATGCYRDGVLLAPLVARLVAEALDGQEPPDLSPRRPREASDAQAVVAAAAGDFAALLLDPEDPGWAARLEHLLLAFGEMALSGDDRRSLHLQRLLHELPLVEMLPEGIVEILQDTPYK